MPVCRVRQVVAGIEMRHESLRNYDASLIEWNTRVLATVIAATVPMQKGQRNPLAEYVEGIKLGFLHDEEFEAEEAALQAAKSKQRYRPEFDPAVFVEQGSQVASNPAGSFERFAGGQIAAVRKHG